MAAGADGQRVEAAAVPVPGSYRELLAVLSALVPEASAGRVAGVGCGIPGTSDGYRALFVPALPWLEGENLARDLAEALGAPVTVGNDGQLTLLAESVEGAAQGASSAALVAVGTGIGGAVMIEGRIWGGHRGSAGAWGWLPAPEETSQAGHGPFERAASGRALAQLSEAAAAGTSPEDLVQAARRGEPGAVAVLEVYAARLASGIAAVASTLDPEVVIVGGGLSAAMDLLGPLIEPRAQALASPNGRKVKITAAALGPRAALIGSLLSASASQAQGQRGGPAHLSTEGPPVLTGPRSNTTRR